MGTSSQFPLGAPNYEFTRVKSSFDLGPAGPSSVSCFASFGAFFRSVCILIYAGSGRALHLGHLEGHNPVGARKVLVVPCGQARCKSSQSGTDHTLRPLFCKGAPLHEAQ